MDFAFEIRTQDVELSCLSVTEFDLRYTSLVLVGISRYFHEVHLRLYISGQSFGRVILLN